MARTFLCRPPFFSLSISVAKNYEWCQPPTGASTMVSTNDHLQRTGLKRLPMNTLVQREKDTYAARQQHWHFFKKSQSVVTVVDCRLPTTAQMPLSETCVSSRIESLQKHFFCAANMGFNSRRERNKSVPGSLFCGVKPSGMRADSNRCPLAE